MPAALQGPSGQVVLNTPVFTLGRATGNQLVLNDTRASAHHAVLQLQGQSYTITDTGSSNGTFVNEQPLVPNVPVLLRKNDTIRIGSTVYTYEDGSNPSSGVPPVVADGYEPTVKASQPPFSGSYGQGGGMYGQNTPSSPGYPPNQLAFGSPYGQNTPSSPNYPPEQGTQISSGNPYGQSGGTFGQNTPSSPTYPSTQGTQPSAGNPYGQSGGAFGQNTPSSPNYPPEQGTQLSAGNPYGQSGGTFGQNAPSSPNYPPEQGTQLASGSPYGQDGGAFGQSAPSSPNYPPNQGMQPAPSNPYGQGSEMFGQSTPSSPNYPPNQGMQPAPGSPYGQGMAYGQAAYAPNSQPGVGDPYNPAQPSYQGAPYGTPDWNANAAPTGAPGTYPPNYIPPVQAKKKHGLRTFLIILLVVVIILGGGVGAVVYFITRPQPIIHVTSNYTANSTAAGADTTTLHITGQKFSDNSAITFLLDGSPAAGNKPAQSDANGNVSATLTITDAWAVGNHTITAKDASNYATKTGVNVTIVSAGQDHTPGPNGSPSDDTSGTVQASIQGSDGNETITLTVTGKPDGGTVCRDVDDGQPRTVTGVASGVGYSETSIGTCSGTYKGGKLSYIETVTKDVVTFDNGLICTAHVPYVVRHLEGTFSNATSISGTYSSDAITLDCNMGVGTNTSKAATGSWTGIETPE